MVRFEDYDVSRAPIINELWQEERTVVFSRTQKNPKFMFDPAASNISAEFKSKIFAFDSMSENDFLEFAFDRLLENRQTSVRQPQGVAG